MKHIAASLGFFVLAACTPLRPSQPLLSVPRSTEFVIDVHTGAVGHPGFTIMDAHGRVTLDGELLSKQDTRKFMELKLMILKSPEWRNWATTPSGTDLPWNGPAHEFWNIDWCDAGLRIARSRMPPLWRSRMMSIRAYVGAEVTPHLPPG